MRITDVHAQVLSYRFPEPPRPLSVGSPDRRDVVLVRVTTEDGTTGHGESFHGHAGTAVAEIVNTTLHRVVVGREVHDAVGLNDHVHRRFVDGAGMSDAFLGALSGVDIAMWDARGKVEGRPVAELLGGTLGPVPAYGGGFALGFQEPARLVEAAAEITARLGVGAIKVRVGDHPSRDLARVRAVRDAFGDELQIMLDANSGLPYDVARIVRPLEELGVVWLEEPYAPTRRAAFVRLRQVSTLPLAGGENLIGAHQFYDWIDTGAIDVVQPDVSRCGGITEAARIAALARISGRRLAPHISHSGLNHAATLHLVRGLGADAWFEADASIDNPFRDGVLDGGVRVVDGLARTSDAPGLGVQVDEERLAAFPGQTGSPFS
ncbi:mandelate racemase/muconate lactonizing enzyme family protein [Egicoccus halophilus]|uniref:D-galactarolactone cycloisomerase n=1 Tax=Egicoccus halophilus TaxID=1670830 RepID=A0A8J3EYW6_9ACTN|nr:mandelate racemase/muconate lactonizing enzyme family protein [Egicoccus halophilus]GGI08683.1 D-galactarolactone cycloisomerase [Egicoccus halophilus]